MSAKEIGLFVLLLPLFVCSPPGSVNADTFKWKSIVINYSQEGQGEPVVLIHDLYSDSEINWRVSGVVDALSKKYKVITLDLRGHGRSSRPKRKDGYGYELAGDVLRLLDHLKIRRAHFVGDSLGGMIVMRLMVTEPRRILSAMLVGNGWLPKGAPLRNYFERVPGRLEAKTPTPLVPSIKAIAVSDAEVKSIQTPVALVVGANDVVQRFYVSQLHELRPDWSVRLIEGAGHLNCVIKDQFKQELQDWLDARRVIKHALPENPV